MGLFDVLSPFLSRIDGVLSAYLSTWVIMALWGGCAALVSTLIFKKVSNPKKTSTLKLQLKTAQQQLNDHDGEFSELKTLAAETMKLSLKRMLLTFFPAMLASIPVIFLLTHLSNRYDLKQPKPVDSIAVDIVWEEGVNETDKLITTSDGWIKNADIKAIKWPAIGKKTVLSEGSDAKKFLELPMPLSTVIHKKLWWNALIGNPAGYLDENSHVNHIGFDFEKQQIIDFGPLWMRDWLVVFLFFTVIFSVLFMVIFRVKF